MRSIQGLEKNLEAFKRKIRRDAGLEGFGNVSEQVTESLILTSLATTCRKRPMQTATMVYEVIESLAPLCRENCRLRTEVRDLKSKLATGQRPKPWHRKTKGFFRSVKWRAK